MEKSMFDLIIKNGNVIDGTGSEPKICDIAVKGDLIAELGRFDESLAPEIYDAKGFFVCPGFIDIHSHSDFTALIQPPGQSKIRQGITTEVCGNCGMSASPLFGAALKQRQGTLKEFGIEDSWSDLHQYFFVLSQKSLFTNIIPLTGHGNIRACVLGYENISPSPEQMAAMQSLLRDELKKGSWGMSSGLIYPPGVYAEKTELVELAKIVAEFGGIYTSHIRSESDFLVEAVEEAVDIGSKSDASVLISHLKTMGSKNWDRLEAVFEIIEKARQQGVKIFADRYPYTAAATELDAVLPAWACEGGNEAEIVRLKDRSLREKIFEDVSRKDYLADEVVVSSVASEKNRNLQGKTLSECAVIRNQSIRDTLFDLLLEENLKVEAFFFCMSDENLKKILRKKWVVIGSDSSVWDRGSKWDLRNPHPRSFGTFPKFIRKYVHDEKLFSIEDAVKKMTGDTAGIIGIEKRGRLALGFFADMVVFNMQEIRDMAVYEQPRQYPAGIESVMVNGKWAIKGGELTGNYPGKVILKTEETLK